MPPGDLHRFVPVAGAELVAMSVLALPGLRYRLRIFALLLFEVASKLLWLGAVPLPLWWNHHRQGAALDQVAGASPTVAAGTS